MEIGAAYVRTSQEKDDAFSLDSQLKAIRAFAREQEIQIPEANAFREEFTGKALDRPKLAELCALIRSKQITAIVIYATDRLAREEGQDWPRTIPWHRPTTVWLSHRRKKARDASGG